MMLRIEEVALEYTDPMTVRKRLSREESRAQTRAHLLEAAEHLFARQGYEATSVEEVAEQAGYTRGALYSNYANKEELLIALIEKCFSRDLERVNAVLEAELNPEQRNALIVNHLLNEAVPKEQLLLQHEFRGSGLRNPAVQQVYSAQLERLNQAIGALIERHARDLGIALPLEGHVLAATLTAIRNGVLTQRHLYPESVDPSLTATLFYRILGADLAAWRFGPAQG